MTLLLILLALSAMLAWMLISVSLVERLSNHFQRDVLTPCDLAIGDNDLECARFYLSEADRHIAFINRVSPTNPFHWREILRHKCGGKYVRA